MNQCDNSNMRTAGYGPVCPVVWDPWLASVSHGDPILCLFYPGPPIHDILPFRVNRISPKSESG